MVFLALVSGLAGCTCESTKFVGGSAALRETAEALTTAFLDDALETHICRVEIEDDPKVPVGGDDDGGVNGYYNATTRVVHVDSEPVHMTFEETLRHELCHAIDRQNGVVKRDSTTWRLDPSTDSFSRIRAGHLAAEGWAAWCALGPEALHLSEREEALDLLEVGFPRHDAPAAVELEREHETEWDAPPGLFISGDEAYPREDGGIEFALTGPTGPGEVVALHPMTCDPIEPSYDWVFDPIDTPFPPPGWDLGSNAVALDAGMLTWGMLRLPDGSVSRPWLVATADGWSRGDDGHTSSSLRGVVDVAGQPYGVQATYDRMECFQWSE